MSYAIESDPRFVRCARGEDDDTVHEAAVGIQERADALAEKHQARRLARRPQQPSGPGRVFAAAADGAGRAAPGAGGCGCGDVGSIVGVLAVSGAHVSAVDPVAVAAQLRALLAEIDAGRMAATASTRATNDAG